MEDLKNAKDKSRIEYPNKVSINVIYINTLYSKQMRNTSEDKGRESDVDSMFVTDSISSFFANPYYESASAEIKISSFEDLSPEDLKALIDHPDRIVALEIGSFRGLSEEILEKLNQNPRIRYGLSGDIGTNIFTKDRFYKNADMKELLQIFEDIKRFVPENGTEFERFLSPYMLLAMVANYDQTGAKSSGQATEEMIIKTRSLKGFFMEGKAVCVGFAIAAKYCLEYLGFEVRMVESKTHAWIQVKIEGKWYNADLTNDRYYLQNRLFPPYCLRSDKEFEEYDLNLDENHETCDEDYPREKIEKALKKLRKQFAKFKSRDIGQGYKKLMGLDDYRQIAYSTTIPHSFFDWMKHIIALWKNEGRENGEIKAGRDVAE